MPNLIVMDELHLTLSAPRGLTPAQYRSIRRALTRPGFRAALDAAVRQALRRYPSLRAVRVTVSR
jgi:hypothetical protein